MTDKPISTDKMLDLLESLHRHQEAPLTPLGEEHFKAIVARIIEYDWVILEETIHDLRRRLSAPAKPRVSRRQIEKFVEGSIHRNMGLDELANAVQGFLRCEGVEVDEKNGGAQ